MCSAQLSNFSWEQEVGGHPAIGVKPFPVTHSIVFGVYFDTILRRRVSGRNCK